MLAEIETDLIAHIKASALGGRLRDVDGLPDLDGESLVSRFAANPPAVYLAPASFQIESHCARLRFGLACVARNSRGQGSARRGDGAIGPVGLYEMLETMAALFDDALVAKSSWKATRVDFMNDEALYKAGITVGIVQIETRVKMFTI